MRATGKSTMQLRVIVLFLDQNTKARKLFMVNGLVNACWPQAERKDLI